MQGEASPARLLIADDHAMVREGIRTMLASEPDLEVVGEAENGREALELCRSLSPDLVLMDLRMPEMDGLEATRAIKGERPVTSVLMVTTHENPEYLLDAVRSGAAGYILKESTKRQLLNAVREVLSGEPILDQELVMRVLRRLSDEQAQSRTERPTHGPAENERRGVGMLPEPLTARELEALRLLAVGKTNRQIAQDLRVSLSTAKAHVQHVIAKLEVSDRTQAAVRAVELGLLSRQEEELL